VRELARMGMIVYLGSRDEAAGKAAAEEAKADGDIRPVTLDVKQWDQLEAAVALIDENHGKLDVLVNNAGVAQNPKPASTADWDKVRDTMEVNVWGPTRLIQLALPLLRKSGSARIVNVSSTSGSIDGILNRQYPMGSMKPFAYSISKTTMNGMTALFADELKNEGIKVNACSPGFVKSALNHYMGTKTPEDGAKIVLHLATLPDDGPTGGFFDDKGVIPW
jgi:NAD(P)-dependent dehydrogenase (short-subunit alcohol dehydrogenase family)